MELALKSWPTALEKRLSSSLSSSDVEDLDRLRRVGGMSQEWVEQHDVKFALELFEGTGISFLAEYFVLTG
jgi:hypothetical protein